MNKTRKADRILDAVGLECPQPVVHARNLLIEMPPGALLEVLVDDPLAELDFTVFCRRTGHELLEIAGTESGQRILIRRRPGDNHS